MKIKVLLKSVVVLALVVLSACSKEKQLFEKHDALEAGIDFENKLNPTEDFNIIDYLYFYNGGGVAVGDINGDSLPDIFFSGNQVGNKLYLNNGNLKFEDVTEKAGIKGKSSWNTGSVMGDVNGDGLLDIYVCAVVGLANLRGHNELFINNGDATFTEKSAEYGLDFESYSSSAAFLDYDLDGDLDMYLLNHAIHTPGSFGHANQRNVRTYETGDKLLRNDGGKFVDVSEQANIYGGINGYGLGMAIADFNVDGFPDIYVGNDFHEDDYLYINNGNGTFREQGRRSFTIMSKFSMGNDAADINHDGFPDLITLDMLPEDETVLKRSEADENINILKMRTSRYGYGYQFPRNMLQINQGNGEFLETALMSGVAATDWSWSALFSDYDQDGHQDLFISNGIPKRPNDLDYIKFVSSEQIVKTMDATKLVDQKALALMPSGKARNCIFKGSGSYAFEQKTELWLPNEKTCATASALADLDNDGDVDIVINNVDDKPGLYINQTNASANYLKIKLKYSAPNSYGIGTRIFSYHKGSLQFKELYTVRGFQASSEPILHFGYGQESVVDSIKVIWPDGSVQVSRNVKTNQTITISLDKPERSTPAQLKQRNKLLFQSVSADSLGLNFIHKEDEYTDFDRLKLLPYQQSDRGPATAVGDLNNDGMPDIYFGGSKHIPGQIYLQQKSGFVDTTIPSLLSDSIKEDTEAVIADFNLDGKSDLFIGTGGADFFGKSKPLLDAYYIADGGEFTPKKMEEYYENASCLRPFDFDADGDLDLFVGNESVSNDFGSVPKSSLLVNKKGEFEPTQKAIFDNIGMVTDAVWDDFDQDGLVDLVTVGEWMEPKFFKNNRGTFEQVNLLDEDLSGLWQSILPFDINGDGKTDYMLGNWGLNSKFKASKSSPMRMYYNDFDKNGTSETVLAIEKKGKYFPLDGFDLLSSQIVSLKKKYTSYESFAGKEIDDLFTSEQLKKSILYEVSELASGYLKNENGKFVFVAFPPELQLSPIMVQLKDDFDADGKQEVLLAGNYFGVQPFHGRFGSFPGAIVKNEREFLNGRDAGLDLVNQSVRHLNIIAFQGDKYLMVTINNDQVQLYKIRH